MPFEFKLPDLGEGIVEGEIVKWLVKEGDTVREDMPLMEVMTDKATVEITSPKNGKISKILKQAGAVVQVEQPMVLIDVDGEAPSAKPTASAAAPQAAAAKPAAPAPAATRPTGPVQASPATRKLAAEMGVDLSQVAGSGPGGRITNEDVQAFAGSTSAAPAAAKPAASQATAAKYDGPVEFMDFRGIRKKIAEHMHQSIHNAAHFSYVDTVDMTDLVALRAAWKKDAEAKGAKLTYLPFIMKAVVEALKKFPRFNCSLDEAQQKIVLKRYYNLGVATATERGLIVPVVRHCENKSLLQLAKEVDELSEKTRNNKAELHDLQGSTFTITSLGALGGLFATPIINYPESAIMGIYQIKPTPVVIGDQIKVRQIMYFSLSIDHRLVDGHEAAGFGNEFKKYLEQPSLIFGQLS